MPKFYTVNTTIKLKKILLPFIFKNFYTKCTQNATKGIYKKKHYMLKANFFEQSRKFDTYTVGDVGHI